MTDIDTLIRELEGATKGSRELDGRIDVAVMDAEGEQWPARYTTSLDAALTLVPEGRAIVCWSNTPKGIGIQVGKKSVMFKGGSEQAEMLPGSTILDDQPFLVRGAHRTDPALALCIAALKARGAA